MAADGQRKSRRLLPDERLQLPIAVRRLEVGRRDNREEHGARLQRRLDSLMDLLSVQAALVAPDLRTDAHLLEQLLREHVVQIGDPALIVLGDALIVDARS